MLAFYSFTSMMEPEKKNRFTGAINLSVVSFDKTGVYY